MRNVNHEAGFKVLSEEPYVTLIYLYGGKGDYAPGWYLRRPGQAPQGPYESAARAEEVFGEVNV